MYGSAMTYRGFKNLALADAVAAQLRRLTLELTLELDRRVTQSQVVECLLAQHNPNELRRCLAGDPAPAVHSDPVPPAK